MIGTSRGCLQQASLNSNSPVFSLRLLSCPFVAYAEERRLGQCGRPGFAEDTHCDDDGRWAAVERSEAAGRNVS